MTDGHIVAMKPKVGVVEGLTFFLIDWLIGWAVLKYLSHIHLHTVLLAYVWAGFTTSIWRIEKRLGAR